MYDSDEELVVMGYTDASFMTDPDDFKSQSGYVFTLKGGAMSWKSSKQNMVVDSTTEAKYNAASEASKEGYWIKKFVTELGVVPSAEDPMELYCDNSGAVAQAREPRSHQKSKHIERRYHKIREFIDKGYVKVCKIHTDLNISDPMTYVTPVSHWCERTYVTSIIVSSATGRLLDKCPRGNNKMDYYLYPCS